jgi:hypothetical protein
MGIQWFESNVGSRNVENGWTRFPPAPITRGVGFHRTPRRECLSLICVIFAVVVVGCRGLTNSDSFVSLSGTVVDRASMEAIDSASVSIDSDLSQPYAITDSAGAFHFDVIAAHRLVIYAGREGYSIDSLVVPKGDGPFDSLLLQLTPL